MKKAGFDEFPHPSQYMLPPLLMEPDPAALISDLTSADFSVQLSRPLIVGWLMTTLCQLQCRHCCINRNAAEASPAERRIIAEKLAGSGACRIALSGGEVTLLPDLAECIYILKQSEIPVSLYTNGIELGAMHWLESWDRQLDYVQISIDGGSRKTYEAQRGCGTFRLMKDGLARLRRENVRVVAHYVASPWNRSDLQPAAELAGFYGCEAFVAEMFISAGRAANQDRSVAAEVAKDFIRSAGELLNNKILMNGEMSIHLAIPSIVPLPEWYAEPLRNLGDVPLQTRSIYGTTHCFVMPNGDMVPTPAVGNDPAYYSGSLVHDDLLPLWKNGTGFSRFQKTRDLRGTLCDGCPDLALCGGGCEKRTLALTGTLDTHDPWCHRSPQACSVVS